MPAVQIARHDAAGPSRPHLLPPLPYPEDSLEPVISARTLGIHHGRHHRAYVDNLNALVRSTSRAESSLEDVVLQTHGDPAARSVFEQAAQSWNHAFYWRSLSPRRTQPSAALAAAIERDVGGLDALRDALAAAAVGHFGSGWAWLVADGSRLATCMTHDADTPLVRGLRPLLVIDVWEHAYYLDHENRRADYVRGVVDRLLDWEFASLNYAAQEPAAGY